MSRFEKKCVVGSAALHGLLLVTFLFGAAFLPSKKPEKSPPVITIFDAKVTDQMVASGGNPNGNPEPPAPAPQPEKVQPPPPEPPKPEVKPKEPDKVEPRKEATPVPEKDKGDVPVAKKQPDKQPTQTAKAPINTKLTVRTNNLAQLERDRADRDRKAREDAARQKEERDRLRTQIGGIIGGVGKSLNKSTIAEPIGPGGTAYVNYASLVGETYKRAVYAEHPQSDEDADAVIRVVVMRDGSVRSSEWVRRTSSPVLNKAVERAMNRVRSLPEFPPETKDTERSFNITIAFDAKRVSA